MVRVPTQLMAHSRDSLRTRGKSDPIDALAVARAVLREPGLPAAFHDEVASEMKLLVGRRDDLLGQRTATVNRLLWRLHWLDPGRKQPSVLIAATNRRALAEWLSGQPGLVAELAREELADIERLTVQIDGLANRIHGRIATVAPTLLALQGCGDLTAARIAAQADGIARFDSEAAWASYVGVAPKPHWSAGTRSVPFRLGWWGNRQLNMAVHNIAVTQVRRPGAGQTYYQRRIREGAARKHALRCLKRQVARAVYHALKADTPSRAV